MRKSELDKIEETIKKQIIQVCKFHGLGKLFISIFRRIKLEEILTSREVVLLNYRFGLEDGIIRTLKESSKKFGVTEERVRFLEAKALQKLRKKLPAILEEI